MRVVAASFHLITFEARRVWSVLGLFLHSSCDALALLLRKLVHSSASVRMADLFLGRDRRRSAHVLAKLRIANNFELNFQRFTMRAFLGYPEALLILASFGFSCCRGIPFAGAPRGTSKFDMRYASCLAFHNADYVRRRTCLTSCHMSSVE